MVNRFKFSQKSLNNLNTCHEDLKTLCNKVINVTPYDIGITWGKRTNEEQYELFKKGRELNIDSGKWEIYNSAEVVTYKDGITTFSKHNTQPYSLAIDFVVYDENNNVTWEKDYYLLVIGVFYTIANQYNIKIKSGRDFEDYGHIELVENSYD